MISPETTARLLTYKASEDSYVPLSQGMLQLLATKTLVQLVGPTSSGKSTLMGALETQFEDFSVVGTGTTRAPREGDHPTRYHYIEHSDEALQTLFAKIDNTELIQYYVTPKPPHYVYWSELQDYKAANNIGDYFSSVIDNSSGYGFARALPISLTREVEPWIDAVNARFPLGNPERLSRLEEAASSISWSLRADHDNHAWILVAENNPESNLTQLRNIVNGSPAAPDDAIIAAKHCLEKIQQMIAEESI